MMNSSRPNQSLWQTVPCFAVAELGALDAFHVEDAGRILVEVHQVVRDLAGTLLADERGGIGSLSPTF